MLVDEIESISLEERETSIKRYEEGKKHVKKIFIGHILRI
jgi:hypothetical protein